MNIPEIRRLPTFASLVEPHRKVHVAAQLVLQHHEANRPQEALEALATLNTASHEVQRILEKLAEDLRACEDPEKARAASTLQ